MRRRFFFILFVLVSGSLCGQKLLRGRVLNASGESIPATHVLIRENQQGSYADSLGYFTLRAPPEDFHLDITSIGFRDTSLFFPAGQSFPALLTIELNAAVVNLSEIVVRREHQQELSLKTIPIRDMLSLPALSDQVSALIKTLPGVSSSNELSNQYTVRGGSFDENLIYINGIQVYRPFLIRSGQQEGLSIVNGDMVSNLSFSAGGFAPEYGDRMSSVLDITYRQPEENRGSLHLSLLNSSFHYEGLSADQRFTYNLGVRYKTTRLVLSSLDDKGNYQPDFSDLQAFFTYQLNPKSRLEFLSTLAVNSYRFFPESRRSTFGTVSDAVELYVYYEGNEKDRYTSGMTALSYRYNPVPRLSLDFTASAYLTDEEENFDIRGYFALNQLDYNLGSKQLGDSLLNIGVGSFLNHARNKLQASIYAAKHQGEYRFDSHLSKWGVEVKKEMIRDRIREWSRMDSAGYSLPYNGEIVQVQNFVKSEHDLDNYRFTSYYQHSYLQQIDSSELRLTMGVRTHYWSFTGEWNISPRYYISLVPGKHDNLTFYLAGGLYYQPPFYKEYRRDDGSLNRHIKAQKSLHWLGGTQYNFQAWERPFRLNAEIYYKQLNRLIPYKLDNIQLMYAAENRARGYVAGMDVKLHGEFLPETESWISLSLMKTGQDLSDDFYLNEEGQTTAGGWHPRPTDQRLTFSLFFQDYFPGNPSFKVHVSTVYNTGLPTSSPYNERYDQVFRMPAYRRVDLGISKQLIHQANAGSERFKGIREMNIGLEVFNLLDINNTVSYLWINTINNQNYEIRQYGIPNYLTGRRINLKLDLQF